MDVGRRAGPGKRAWPVPCALCVPNPALCVLKPALCCAEFNRRRLSEAVFDPANKYEFPSTLIIRTPSEVGTLLGAPTPTPVTSSAPVSALATPLLGMPPLPASAALQNAAATTHPVSGVATGSL